jgi:uncharacterized membrane protein YgaE (UPF0421/DUF939 family)
MFILEFFISLILSSILFSFLFLTLFINIPLTIFFNKLEVINVTFSFLLIVILSPIFLFFGLVYLVFFYLNIPITIPIIIGLILGFIMNFQIASKNKKDKVQDYVRYHKTIFKDSLFALKLLSPEFDESIEKQKVFKDKAVEVAIVDLYYDSVSESLNEFINNL